LLQLTEGEYSPRSIIWDKFVAIEQPKFEPPFEREEIYQRAASRPDPSGFKLPPRLSEWMRRRGGEKVDDEEMGPKTKERMEAYYEAYRVWKEAWDKLQYRLHILDEKFVKGLDYEDIWAGDDFAFVKGRAFQGENLAGVNPEHWYRIMSKPGVNWW
jgi:hypothetical protein